MGARSVFNIEGEGGVFDLDGVDGVDGCGAEEGGGGAFREAEVVCFSRVHGRGHGGDDGFDGDFAVEAMARWGGDVSDGVGLEWCGEIHEPVPEIDVVGLQSLQTLINGICYVFGLIGEDPRAVCKAVDAEFGGEEDLYRPVSTTISPPCSI